jgi:hypothetical protein
MNMFLKGQIERIAKRVTSPRTNSLTDCSGCGIKSAHQPLRTLSSVFAIQPCFPRWPQTSMHNCSRPHHTTFMDRHFLCCCFLMCFLSVLVLLALKAFASGVCAGSISSHHHTILPESPLLHKKINFVFKDNRRTVNPAGWEEYDGSIYRSGGWYQNVARRARQVGAGKLAGDSPGKSAPRLSHRSTRRVVSDLMYFCRAR